MKHEYKRIPRNPGRAVFEERNIWIHLGWRDLQSRYSRTFIGPWWSVANLLTIVLGSSLAVGLLSGQSALSQAPRVALALSLWLFLSATLNEAVELFEAEKGLLLNTQISEASLVVRLIWRNYLVYLHSLVVVIVTFLIAREPLTLRLLSLIPISLIGSLGMIFPAYIFARSAFILRDLKVLLPSVVQFVFFVTPILWNPPESGLMHTLFTLNPVGWIIEFLRQLILEARFNGSLLTKVCIAVFVSLILMSFSARSMRTIRKLL